MNNHLNILLIKIIKI